MHNAMGKQSTTDLKHLLKMVLDSSTLGMFEDNSTNKCWGRHLVEATTPYSKTLDKTVCNLNCRKMDTVALQVLSTSSNA